MNGQEFMNRYLDIMAEITTPGVYPPQDAYRDFRRVFLDSDEGRRVLKCIMKWAKITDPLATGNPVDIHRLAIGEGQRNLALKILNCMLVEPPQQQTETKRSPKDAS